ncbi:DNA-binding protein [Patescibacteria group bacterium]|nr:MAG: DNA-binding protein [Patescibacteria group bacterium]
MMQEKFLSLKDARKILGVSERSMYRYIHDGRLKAYKIGYWKIKEKDLQEFIEQSFHKPEETERRS